MGGLFGVTATFDCVKDLFYGTDYHFHLGTRRGGMAVKNSHEIERSIHNIENDYFRSKFEADLQRFRGNSGIGVISDYDAQPLVIGSHLGTFALVTVGRINNLAELENRAFRQRAHFTETAGGQTNPTEMVAMLICEENSFEDGIRHAQKAINGSCSMLLLTDDGIFAARDRLGRTPIVLGKKTGAFAAASETCAFPNLGYAVDRFLGPGEVVFLSPEGTDTRRPAGDRMQVCAFLWVYYGYPASEYEGVNVEYVRNRCGAALAQGDDARIDCVAGIPDSGIGHAIGYANEKKIPYVRPFVKYTPTWPRSFMPQDQSLRDLVAKMKLIPIRRLIDGRSILFCEDSIVRGTQLKDNIQVLFDYGAREIHMRPACPTLIYPCEFLNFSTSRSTLDLAGRKTIHELEGENDSHLNEYASPGSDRNRIMVERIQDQLRLTSLKYQRLDDLIAAIGLPKESLCTHCWDGSSYF
ncbi:MAG: amidophosphoribosyltransferase [Deltaproteobacteria bacterium SG8_13]|nr:MAG: amidophosphoribosyltransferase [Deltaproteobacteria bacterium SG8_13]